MIVRSPLSFADASFEMLSVFALEVLSSFSFAENTGVAESVAANTNTAAVKFLFVFVRKQNFKSGSFKSIEVALLQIKKLAYSYLL